MNKNVSLGLVFAGGCGTNIASNILKEFDPKDHPHLKFLVVNTDSPELREKLEDSGDDAVQRWTVAEQLTTLHVGESGMGAGGKPDVGRAAAEAKTEEFKKFLEPLHAVIAMGGGGGGTGSGILPFVAKLAKDMGKPILCVVTFPLAVEGGRRLKKAQAVRDALKDCPTIAIYNEEIPDKDQGFEAAFKAINSACPLPMLRALREIIQDVGDVMNLDLEDWKSALEAGNYVQFGYLEVRDDDISGIAKRLLLSPYQNRAIVKNAREFLVWLHGPWLISEYQELILAIQANMADQNVGDESIEINPGMLSKPKDEKKWVALLAVAREAPADEPETVLRKSVVRDEGESGKVLNQRQPTLVEKSQTSWMATKVVVNGKDEVVNLPPELIEGYKGLFSNTATRLTAIAVIEKISQAINVRVDLPRHLSAAR